MLTKRDEILDLVDPGMHHKLGDTFLRRRLSSFITELLDDGDLVRAKLLVDIFRREALPIINRLHILYHGEEKYYMCCLVAFDVLLRPLSIAGGFLPRAMIIKDQNSIVDYYIDRYEELRQLTFAFVLLNEVSFSRNAAEIIEYAYSRRDSRHHTE